MTETGRQIANLMINNGKSAPDMTHAVKVLGNGSMQDGFARIGKYFLVEISDATNSSLITGRIQGCFAGVLGMGIITSIVTYAMHKNNKNNLHEAEGQTILNTMQDDASSEKDPIMSNESTPVT